MLAHDEDTRRQFAAEYAATLARDARRASQHVPRSLSPRRVVRRFGASLSRAGRASKPAARPAAGS